MGQAVMDLPNPLDNPPSAAAGGSADDLLAKLAGDEIDRMLAESDIETTADDAPADSASAASTASEVGQENPASGVDLDAVLETAEAERTALKEESAHHEKTAHGPNIDLGETAEQLHRLPLIFKPLVWLNAPLDPWPDRLREVIGKIAVVTLINALAVIAYVLLFRRHHH